MGKKEIGILIFAIVLLGNSKRLLFGNETHSKVSAAHASQSLITNCKTMTQQKSKSLKPSEEKVVSSGCNNSAEESNTN